MNIKSLAIKALQLICITIVFGLLMGQYGHCFIMTWIIGFFCGRCVMVCENNSGKGGRT